MAYLSTFRFKGDPDTLLRIKREDVEPAAFEIARRYGAIAHFYARADDGLVLYTIWETSQGPEAVKEIGPIARAAGMPPAEHEVVELAGHHHWGAADGEAVAASVR